MQRRATRDQVRRLLEAGMSQAAVARQLGLNPSTVCTHALRLGFGTGRKVPTKYDWKAIRAYYEEGHMLRECRERFGFSAGAWDQAVARGDVLPRPREDRIHAHQTRKAVQALVADGRSQAAIAAELGISKSTVAFHVRNLGVPPDQRFNRRYDWEAVQRAIEQEGLTRKQGQERFGFCKHTWYQAVKRGEISPNPHVVTIEELLVAGRRRGRNHLKTRILRAGLKQNRCEICGINEWQGKPLSMALHHINGDGTDNRLDNLQLLCANCHSQTPNYGGRNGHRKPRPA
jgi:DNA-binding CsgD family transcriptional regulator